MQRLIATSNEYTLALARFVLGVIFFLHGAQLTLGWFHGYGFHGAMQGFVQSGIPAVFAFLAIMAQFLGGIGLIVGFLSRIAAFGVTIVMLVAIFTVHLHNGIFMNWSGAQKGEGYEYHLLVIVLCILIMVKGAGALSVDRALTKA